MKNMLREPVVDIKQNLLVTQHFIFSISPPTPHRPPLLYRIGIDWQALLRNIPIASLNLLFAKEVKVLIENYPGIILSKKRIAAGHRLDKPNLIKFCNYISPENTWISEVKVDTDASINKLLIRINELLGSGWISTWIAGQIIDNIFKMFAELYSDNNVFRLIALDFLNNLISIFDNKAAKFFSFIFNQCQKAFIMNHYEISVFEVLLQAELPSNFLQEIYFAHPNNFSARVDLNNWIHKNQSYISYQPPVNITYPPYPYLVSYIPVEIAYPPPIEMENFSLPPPMLSTMQPSRQSSSLAFFNTPSPGTIYSLPLESKLHGISQNSNGLLTGTKKRETPVNPRVFTFSPADSYQ